MAVRSCCLTVDPGVPDSTMHTQIREVCKALLWSWADVDDSNITISKISGGITNLLKAAVEGEGPSAISPVAVRIFGPNTDAVINREREFQAVTFLSSGGFGAKVLGIFANGMVQSFIAARTLTPSDIAKPEFAARIAREVRRLHDLEIPSSSEPQLWADISKFIDKACAISFEDCEKQKVYEKISFDDLRAEVKAVKDISDTLAAPIVFAHNDLLSGNFMYNEETGQLHLIDFEYGSYNYRGYDIGNFFNEHAGYECDYSLYPNKEAQYHFFRHYLYPDHPEEASDVELEVLYAESNFYALASHLYWGIWAIVQAKFSPIEFDYLSYFFLRLNEYKRQKKEFFEAP